MRLFSSSAPRDFPCSRKMSPGCRRWYTSTSICWGGMPFQRRRRFNVGSYDHSGARPTLQRTSPESLSEFSVPLLPNTQHSGLVRVTRRGCSRPLERPHQHQRHEAPDRHSLYVLRMLYRHQAPLYFRDSEICGLLIAYSGRRVGGRGLEEWRSNRYLRLTSCLL
jgi:hypothetical protein